MEWLGYVADLVCASEDFRPGALLFILFEAGEHVDLQPDGFNGGVLLAKLLEGLQRVFSASSGD